MTTPSQQTREPLDTSLSVGIMSLVDHLQELRQRIIICLVAVAITSTVSYFYAENLVKIIAVPAGKLYFMNPAEVFLLILRFPFLPVF